MNKILLIFKDRCNFSFFLMKENIHKYEVHFMYIKKTFQMFYK